MVRSGGDVVVDAVEGAGLSAACLCCGRGRGVRVPVERGSGDVRGLSDGGEGDGWMVVSEGDAGGGGLAGSAGCVCCHVVAARVLVIDGVVVRRRPCFPCGAYSPDQPMVGMIFATPGVGSYAVSGASTSSKRVQRSQLRARGRLRSMACPVERSEWRSWELTTPRS